MRATVKGGEISLLDFIALSLYLSLPRPELRLPFRRSMAIYLAVTALSAIQAMHPVAALFYTLQLGRTFLVCTAVYRGVCVDRRVPEAVLKGLAAGMFLEVAVAVWQRAHGVLQTPGTFDSQNLLGMISHFVIFPFFAAMLGGRRGRLAPAVVAAGLVIAVLTASRGTIALDFLGLATVFVLSALGQWTPRKAKVLWVGVAGMALFAFFAASSLQQRFHGGPELGLSEEDSERLMFKKAAAEMLADHPMGVGANHFTVVANLGGYFTRVGEQWSSGRASNVHNVYWLVAAETGYIGLVAFVAFLVPPLIAAFRFPQFQAPRRSKRGSAARAGMCVTRCIHPLIRGMDPRSFRVAILACNCNGIGCRSNSGTPLLAAQDRGDLPAEFRLSQIQVDSGLSRTTSMCATYAERESFLQTT